MKTTRAYAMGVRAESAAGTRERVLDAVIALSEERLTLEIVLADVAERAGVSVQTVLRHFGSRDGLFEAALARQVVQVRDERAAPVGDAEAAITTLIAFYDRVGDWTMRLLAQEHCDERSRRTVERGRKVHRDWVVEVFAPQLAGRADRVVLVDLLVVATDLYTWKLLRRDRRLGATATRVRMLRLVRAVLNPSSDGG